MTRICTICDNQFRDGDDIVFVGLSKFHEIPSEVAYAVDPPTKCIDLVHSECFDWQDYDEENELIDDEKGAN